MKLGALKGLLGGDRIPSRKESRSNYWDNRLLRKITEIILKGLTG